MNDVMSLSGRRSWDDEINDNTALFREADLLDELAYKIIEYGIDNPEVWTRFTEAKAHADTKRTAAYQDWMRIKRAMRSQRTVTTRIDS